MHIGYFRFSRELCKEICTGVYPSMYGTGLYARGRRMGVYGSSVYGKKCSVVVMTS